MMLDARTEQQQKARVATAEASVERARARTPEERIILALQLGERCRLLSLARTAPKHR